MAIFAIGITIAQAQTPVTDSTSAGDSAVARPSPARKRHSHFDIGTTYQSNDVYLGRKDSLPLPYFIPSISYYHKSGLYITTSLDYLKSAAASRIDLFTIEGGYMFSAHHYEGNFTLSKYFYNSQSTSVTSAIRAAVAYQNAYDFGPIKAGLTATLNSSVKLDYEGLFEISHTFSLLKDNLDITPTLAAGGSTLNYYDYYRQRKYKITKKKKVIGTGIASVTGSVLQPSRFQLLDYEPTLPIEYSIGKFTINFTPTYSIPINPATIDIHTVKENGVATDRTKTESIGNTFYFTVGLSFLF